MAQQRHARPRCGYRKPRSAGVQLCATPAPSRCHPERCQGHVSPAGRRTSQPSDGISTREREALNPIGAAPPSSDLSTVGGDMGQRYECTFLLLSL